MEKTIDPVLQTFFRDKQGWVESNQSPTGASFSATPMLVNGQKKYIQLHAYKENDGFPLLKNKFLAPIHSAFLSQNGIKTYDTFHDNILSFVGEEALKLESQSFTSNFFDLLAFLYVRNWDGFRNRLNEFNNNECNPLEITEKDKNIIIENFALILFFNTYDRKIENIMQNEQGDIFHIDIASSRSSYGLFGGKTDENDNKKYNKGLYEVMNSVFEKLINKDVQSKQLLINYINKFFSSTNNNPENIIPEIVRRCVNANPEATENEILEEIKNFFKRKEIYLNGIINGDLPQKKITESIATNIDKELKQKIQSNINAYKNIDDNFIKNEIKKRKQIYQNTIEATNKFANKKNAEEIKKDLLDGKVADDVAEKNVGIQKKHYLALFNNFDNTKMKIGHDNNGDDHFFFSDTHGDLSLVFWSLYRTGLIEDFERDNDGNIEFLYFDFEGNLLPNIPSDDAQGIVVVPKPKINKNYDKQVYHLGDFLDKGIENMSSCFMLFYIQKELENIGKNDILNLFIGNHELCYPEYQYQFGRQEMTAFCKKQIQTGKLKRYLELKSPTNESVFISHCGRSEKTIAEAKKNIDSHIEDYLSGKNNNPETKDGILQGHMGSPALFKQIYGHYAGNATINDNYICTDNQGSRGYNRDKTNLYIVSCKNADLANLKNYHVFNQKVEIIQKKTEHKKNPNDLPKPKPNPNPVKYDKKEKKYNPNYDDEEFNEEQKDEFNEEFNEEQKDEFKYDKKEKKKDKKKHNKNHNNKQDGIENDTDITKYLSLLTQDGDDIEEDKDEKKTQTNSKNYMLMLMMIMMMYYNNQRNKKDNSEKINQDEKHTKDYFNEYEYQQTPYSSSDDYYNQYQQPIDNMYPTYNTTYNDLNYDYGYNY